MISSDLGINMRKDIKAESAKLRADKAAFYSSDEKRRNECARARRRAQLLSRLEDERVLKELEL